MRASSLLIMMLSDDKYLNIRSYFPLHDSNTLVLPARSASPALLALPAQSAPSALTTPLTPVASVSQVALAKRTLPPVPRKRTRASALEGESGGEKDDDSDYGRKKRARVSTSAASKGKAPQTTAKAGQKKPR